MWSISSAWITRTDATVLDVGGFRVKRFSLGLEVNVNIHPVEGCGTNTCAACTPGSEAKVATGKIFSVL